MTGANKIIYNEFCKKYPMRNNPSRYDVDD